MGSENYKELGVAAAKGVGAEENEASGTQHHHGGLRGCSTELGLCPPGQTAFWKDHYSCL